MSGEHPTKAEYDDLRRALKETVLNLESLAEEVLRRARERLDELPPEDGEEELTDDS